MQLNMRSGIFDVHETQILARVSAGHIADVWWGTCSLFLHKNERASFDLIDDYLVNDNEKDDV